MSNKKSLGHSPLGYDVTGNTNFDFIPDYNALIDSENSDSFEKPRNRKPIQFLTALKKKSLIRKILKAKKL